MDTHFANMRSLIQILDSELFELMHQNGDYTHFYFCYRWFLLDFKRALVEVYREIIRDNNMDFTDIIKFFNGKTYFKKDIAINSNYPQSAASPLL